MRPHFRTLLVLSLAVTGLYACSDSSQPLIQLAPIMPAMIRIKATDSLMRVTDMTYSDTGLVLQRLAPLTSELTATAVIGPKGGSLQLDAAGFKMDIPGGALSAPTTITVRALAGSHVAYEFEPHGLLFAEPVKVTQQVKGTLAGVNPAMLGTAHGGYYDSSLDSSFVDPSRLLIHLKEHQIGYVEATKTQIKFFIGHFSGYIVTCGKSDGE